jgi:hypothetical protein
LKLSGPYPLHRDNKPLARRAINIKVASSKTLHLSAVALIGLLAAVPSGFAQANPTSTQAAANASQHVQLEGELEIVNKDLKDRSEVSYSLKLANGEHVSMRFAKEPPTHLLTGDHVQAEGDLSNNTLLLYSGSNLRSGGNNGSPGSTSTSSTSGPLPNTFGTQSTLVMLVNFQDDAVQPWTVADVQTMFSGTVNNFFKENSYGQTSIAATVVGWYTIPDSVTTCNTSQIATDAQKAAVAAGVVLSNYTRYVYVFPFDSACAFAGTSTVGGKPSESWINGGATVDFHTIDHELGHAFGLWHSHALDCGTSATICSNGNSIDYGDLMDTMGTTADWSPDYNAFQKERLGWLGYGASPSIQTVTSSGAYTINAYESGGAGPNVLKVLQSTDPTTGARTWYYLEARQPIGFDAFITANTFPYIQTVTDSVLFHLGTDGNGNSSELIDMTPATATSHQSWDMGLGVGQSYTDSSAGVSITVGSVSSTGATVQITMSGSTTPGPLTTSVTTNQSSYLPGQTVGITVTAVSGTLPAAGVGVTATVTNPNGNSTTLKGTTGSAGTALLNYNLAKHAPAGTYRVGGTATSTTAGTAVANDSFTVQ